MGLISNLRRATGQTSVQEETARAVLAMPIMVAAADGEISLPETEQIANMCMFSPVFHAVGGKRTQELGVDIVTELKAKGATEVFNRSAVVLSPKLRETALCFAIRTALADGVLEDGEKKMLVTMGEAMGVSEETFVKIFDVMVMMQRAPGVCAMDGGAGRPDKPARYSDKRLADSFSVYVLFTEPVSFTNRDILDALREDFPELSWSDSVAEGGVTPGILDGTHTTGDVVVTSLFASRENNQPGMIPLVSLPGRCDIDWEDMFHKNRLTFPEMRAAGARHQTYVQVIVNSVDSTLEARSDAARRATCIGAVFASLPVATAVYHPNADSVLAPDKWIEAAKTSLKGEVPLPAWINTVVNPVPDWREPVPMTAQTIGMAAFTGHEILLPLARVAPDEAARMVVGGTLLHLQYGNQFNDGDAIGEDEKEDIKLRIRHAPEGKLGLQTDNWVFLHPTSALAPREEELFGKRPGIPPPPGMDVRISGNPDSLRNKLYALVAGPRRKRQHS